MILLAKCTSILMIGAGITFLVKPEWLKKVMHFFDQGKRLYIAGSLRILVGLIFLIAAPQCRLTGGVLIMGIFFLIAGALIFILRPEKMKPLLQYWLEAPVLVHRVLALLPITVGSLLLYLI